MTRNVVATIVAVALVLAFAAAGEGESKGPDAKAPVLDATSGATHRYLPVPFATHARHAKDLGLACPACHHDVTAADPKPAKCSGCHDQPGAKVDLADAMHRSCRGCHEKYVADHKDSKAPTKCLECHVERK